MKIWLVGDTNLSHPISSLCGSVEMRDKIDMNWLECEEIEAVPGKMGGRPVIKGTRIEPMSW